MTKTSKRLLWTVGGLSLAIVAATAYITNRGGHYPTYAASSFAHLALPSANGASADDPVVLLSGGTLRGTRTKTAIAFRGIPYARPPVGELRWQPPRPPSAWQGVRDARQPGASCSQPASGLTPFFDPMAQLYGSRFAQAPIESSEDCLYLDVWVPEWPVKHSLPVMVWLHGGSNILGSGSQPMYEGTSLARHGVLVVTLNYRLGVMGFFSHPELTAESPNHSSGNYGLLDQLAALQWVRQNIAQFGGDSNNVTLFGESAGAIDSALLLSSPLATGLFRSVISESGPAFDPGQTLAQAEAFGSAVGTDLQKLRALSAADVEALVLKAKEHVPPSVTTSTVDGWVLPKSPQLALLTGSIQKVDLLIGVNGREFSAFRVAAAAAAKAAPVTGNAAQPGGLKLFSDAAQPYFGIWTKPAIARYLGRILLDKEAGFDAAATDLLVACPIGAIASLVHDSGAHVFAYRFDRSIPTNARSELGAFHGLEVPYVFGTLQSPEWHWLPATADDARLSALLQTYWSNFAKTGDPNAAGLPTWPAWSDENEEFLLVNPDASVTMQRNFLPLFSSLRAGELKRSFKAN